MNRFKHSHFSTYIRRTTQAYRTGYLRCHVGDDVSIKVERHDHIKNLGAIRNQGCSNIDDFVIGFNSRIFLRYVNEGFMEQTVRQLHDVVLGHASHLFPAIFFSIFKGVADDFFRSWLRNHFQTLVHLLSLAVLNSRIQILLILPNDHQIRFWKMRFDKRRIGFARAYVGIQPKGLSCGDIEGLEASTLGGGDGRFQKNLVGPKRINRLGLHPGTNSFEVHLFSNFDYIVLQLSPCSI